MRKSSIEWLIDQLSPYLCFPLGKSAGYDLQDVITRAKEIHKDEIMDAFRYGNSNEILGKKHPEQYYNETFNNKEEQRKLLKEITEADEKDGLYDDWNNTIQDGLDDELNTKEK